MTLCLPLEMSLSKELLWAYSLSSKTTLMTGNRGGGEGSMPVCQTDVLREKGPADLCGPICHAGSVDRCLCYVPAVTEPSPVTHLNTPKSASGFHSLHLNFYGGSHPAGVCGAPFALQAPAGRQALSQTGHVTNQTCPPGLGTEQFLRNRCLPHEETSPWNSRRSCVCGVSSAATDETRA